jgi:hypothetical protein
LKSPLGGWLTERSEIGACFVNNFKYLFSSSHLSPDAELLGLFDIVISVDDNNLLCALPDESEIFNSLISLGRTKVSGLDGFTALFFLCKILGLYQGFCSSCY